LLDLLLPESRHLPDSPGLKLPEWTELVMQEKSELALIARIDGDCEHQTGEGGQQFLRQSISASAAALSLE
jgi:hypothetical protein